MRRRSLGESGDSEFVAAIKAKDEDALDNLIDKTKPKKTGEESGATLYEDDGTVFAVEDDTVVFAGDRQQLTQALKRADGDDHLDEDAFNEGLDGLPESALARVYADLEALLKSDPGSADARKIKWVEALRTLGVTVVAKDEGIDVDFRVRTEGDLSDEDLPIAPGDDSPDVIKREGEIGLGIRDLAHIVRFAENAGQAVDPAGFGDYAQAKKTIDKQLGVSLDDDLVGQLTGDVSATVSIDGKFGVRAQLKDPAGVRAHAREGGRRPAELRRGRRASAPSRCRSRGGARASTRSRSPTATPSCSGWSTTCSWWPTIPRGRASSPARSRSRCPAPRARWSLSADAEQLVNTLLDQLGPALGLGDLGGLGAALFTRPLGDLNGYMSASTDELRGKLTLAID